MPAHKGILCARSAYFRALLQTSFAEHDQSSVDIPDVSPEAFR
jgi:hypothetical protein